jgi:hypothetical protein
LQILVGIQKPDGSKKSIANYFHHLEEAFFVIGVERFSFGQEKRLEAEGFDIRVVPA